MVMRFIFSNPVSLEPSIARENGADLIVVKREALKCGAKEPFKIHMVSSMLMHSPL